MFSAQLCAQSLVTLSGCFSTKKIIWLDDATNLDPTLRYFTSINPWTFCIHFPKNNGFKLSNPEVYEVYEMESVPWKSVEELFTCLCLVVCLMYVG